MSVASQVVYVLRRLWKRKRIAYHSLFRGKTDRSERVAAFLAVLELIKNRRVRVEGDGENSEIVLVNGREER